MSFWNGTICLQPDLNSLSVDERKVEDIWRDISRYSVEAISANRAGVFDFIEHDCMYFAAIQLLTKKDLEDDAHKSWADHEDDMGGGDDLSSPPRSPTSPISRDKKKESHKPLTIGLIYLTTSHFPGTVNLGFTISPESRKNGYATQAVRMLLPWAFDELKCHRVQVQVAAGDSERHNASSSLLTAAGFAYEGFSRRALFCASASEEERAVGLGGEWRDVSTFAMLDTEWTMRSDWKNLPSAFIKMRWEEMFDRQEYERRLMIALEETADKYRKTERKMSKETITSIPPLPSSMIPERWGYSDDDRHYTPFPGDPGAVDEFGESVRGVFDDGYRSSYNSSPDGTQLSSASSSRILLGTLDGLRADTPVNPARNPRSLRDPFSTDDEESDGFHSLDSSPLLVPYSTSSRSPAPDVDMESDPEAELVPRSPSVSSSKGSASSWDLWETSSTNSFVLDAHLSESDEL